MERIYALPKSASHFHLFDKDSFIKAHDSYKAAKAGDAEAAFTLIKDLALDFLLTIQNKVPHHCIFVSPYAQEATGDNAIPLILSLVCRSEEHTSELQSRFDLVCRLLLEK